MSIAESLAIFGAGIFFLAGLLTGVWKYRVTINLGHSSRYIDIAHRSSLMYSFAALLLAKFAQISQLPEALEVIAVASMLVFFAGAIGSYVLHGALKDTNNQFKPPFHLGRYTIPGKIMNACMLALILVEIGGFAVLFYGVIIEIF